jgi:hypothetical protein
MRIKKALAKLLLPCLAGLPALCQAQWVTQPVRLVPGWNAVFLEVQPEPRNCDQVFHQRPIQSVWKWDRRFSTIQFEVAPTILVPENPDWLMWLPRPDPRSFLNRLFKLQGGQAYLVKVAADAAPFTLPVKGQVIMPRLEWYPHGLNLVGFPVNPRNPPTFTEFFKFTTEVDTTRGYANELYRLDTNGRGQRVVQPARDRVEPGVAYWVGCAGRPGAVAPLSIESPADGVDFGTMVTERIVRLRNFHPTATLTLLARQLDSEAPPATGRYPELAGPVPLSVLAKNASNQLAWTFFPANGESRVLAPGEEWELHLGVRRQDLAPYLPQGDKGAAYQSILEITDSAESLRVRLPVVAQAPAMAVASTSAGLEPHYDQEGLWVGQAIVNQVNAPAYTTNLLSTPAPASLRLLVHVDGYGRANLLQQVLLAWDPTLAGSTASNGMYALYAAENALPADATDVHRISSVAFPIMAPVPLAGDFTNTLTGTVTVRYDDPVNPFLHRYHPMHDNKDWDFVSYTNAVETRTIERALALHFDPGDTAPADPFWGVNALSGVYRETFSAFPKGLRADPLVVQGRFTLQRISRINTLRGITP